MHDELTRSDLQKMQEEIDYRVQVLRPKLIEDVQTARAFGDLSENFEYKCAKQDKNRNDARIRYLQRMIKTAQVIEDRSSADTAGLAVMGARVGDRVHVDMGGGKGYYVRIDAIEKGKDDGSIPIGSF